MKNNILTIMKKELARFFGDKRMMLTTVFLPGIMIYVMYTFMGDALTKMYTVEKDYESKIWVSNLPESIAAMAEAADVVFAREITENDLEEAKEQLVEKKLDLCVMFPENFDADVAAYDAQSGEPAPNVEVYYNTTSTKSKVSYEMVMMLLESYESALSNKFDVNHTETDYDVASEKDSTAQMFSTMLPLLLLMFLFSGCMSVAPESIAGEKERGTIATLLVTPVKRSHIAMGKVFALAVIALLSGLSSATGTLLSLPKLMDGAADEMNMNVYGAGDYALLGIVILSTVLLFVVMISIISTFAKTIKEASTTVMPLMIAVMLVGITCMFGDGSKTEMSYYFIPVYNSVQCMSGIFRFDFIPVNMIACVVSNLVYTTIGVFVITKMFNSEKVMFNK